MITLNQPSTAPHLLPPTVREVRYVVQTHMKSMDDLQEEVQRALGSQLRPEDLLSLSKKLQAEFKEHLITSPQCMLPSHNYVLPTGKEHGTYLALEGLNVCLDAIVNDSSAALLSRAYVDPSTRLALILGTGINAAIHLPIASLHRSKFGKRSMPPADEVTNVLVNTELSMFGKKAYPTTRWDELVNSNHIMPDYQPMEYLVAGPYMGEIVRLILIEATETTGLFGGNFPPSLSSNYTLDARILAAIEKDSSPGLSSSRRLFHKHHPNNEAPNFSDMHFVQQVTRAVSRRSCAYATAGIHALASLLENMEASHQIVSTDADSINIGCDGSIINKYPEYMDKVQASLDQMIRLEDGGRKRVVLEKTIEPAVSGAGVAVAMAAGAP
ncbi:MAG: hypothetical protein Q9195_008001 [Heterodermia aff. obscurata]